MEAALSKLLKQCDGKGAVRGCPIAEFIGGTATQSEKHCHE
jgi:hypothetical protein